MKKSFLYILIFLPLISIAQNETNGIRWSTNLSWQEVREKAKIENKYIFLDCFTTWCGPCKLMDKQVYSNDTVDRYYNDKFISVRVQMDKTAKDDAHVKNWYDDAAKISKDYRVLGYPTFIFLSPNGDVVNRSMGFQPPKEFISLAQVATQPGQVYNDPFAGYDALVAEYEKGEKNYDSFPYMIKTAFKIGEDEFGRQLLNEYTDHVLALPEAQQYTKANIDLWSAFQLRSDSKRFQYFYRNGGEIDKVMNRKGFAAQVVDRTILNEIILPFLEKTNKNQTVALTGMMLTGSGIGPDSTEADWKRLEKEIQKKFDKKCAKRNVLSARVLWYERHRNTPSAVKYWLVQQEQYPRDSTDIFAEAASINGLAFDAFLYVTDKKLLAGMMKWMEILSIRFEKASAFHDTYANLLYKLGRKEDAIQWEEKAAARDQSLQVIVQQMKRGEPTYIEEGAVWK